MKAVFTLAAWLTAAIQLPAAAPRSTAYYIEEHIGGLVGRVHRVRGSRVDFLYNEGENLWYHACTEGTDRSFGGWILVLVPPAGLKKKYSREFEWIYSLQLETHRLAAVVRRTADGTTYLDLTSGDIEQPTAENDDESGEAQTVAPPADHSRIHTWTHGDGRTVEAEFLSATTTHVRIRRISDDAIFTFSIDQLSAADREWLASR